MKDSNKRRNANRKDESKYKDGGKKKKKAPYDRKKGWNNND
jgi:hypothetical protein